MHRRWWLGVAVALLAGCHGEARPAAAPAPAPAPLVATPLHRGPLVEYVPAAGLRWLVVARLQELYRTAWLRQLVVPLFPEEQLDAYALSTGLDLRSAEEALAAGFDYGTLYLARSGEANAGVEARFAERLLGGAVRHEAHPQVRVLRGMVQEVPAALVSQDHHLVGIAFGDPTLARIVDAYARRRLESPTALRGAALSTLPSSLHAAPVRFYAPGPFEREWSVGAQGLLASAVAVGISAVPLAPDAVRVTVVVAGDWGDSAPSARAAVDRFWMDLAASTTGRLLGLDAPRSAPIITVQPTELSLTVDVRLEPLVDGLHAAVSADVWELLDLGRPTPSNSMDGGGTE